jgi:triphosphoribosyl-dephospho-CoA synthetase
LGRAVSVELDERLERFVDQAQRSKSRSAPEVSADLMRAGYLDVVRRLHREYLEGQITLRGMAAELGLEYRELYALLEELDLPLA